MTPEDYLSIPYILEAVSVRTESGVWMRRLEYPELPGCVVEADTPIEALDRLEKLRERYILGRLERGEAVPVPRPPLRA
jgi:predicted RNase H-like HicB family nuclease